MSQLASRPFRFLPLPMLPMLALRFSGVALPMLPLLALTFSGVPSLVPSCRDPVAIRLRSERDPNQFDAILLSQHTIF